MKKHNTQSYSQHLNNGSMTDYGKIPPQATDLEQTVLSALLSDSQAIIEISDILTPEMFYNDEHKNIFEAIQTMFNSGKSIDLLTVTDKLQENGKLEESGGFYTLNKLLGMVANSSHIVDHALIIRQKFIRREMINLSMQTAKNAYDETFEDLEVLAMHERDLEKVSNASVITSEKSLSQIMRQMRNKEKKSGIPVKNALRDIVANLSAPDLIILAARPAMGKTAFAMQIAMECAEYDVPVMVFSLEMSESQLVNRMKNRLTGIPVKRLEADNIYREEAENLLNAEVKLDTLPIFIDDTAGLSLTDFKSKAARCKRKNKIGLIVVDYIQLMSNKSKNGNREQEISEISRGLKIVAKNLGVPVIALSQLSRKCEERGDKKPMLSDLRESGAIEQDADIVTFLYRPEYYGIETIETNEGTCSSAGIAEIIVAKYRQGSTGSCFSIFEGDKMNFKDLLTFTKPKIDAF